MKTIAESKPPIKLKIARIMFEFVTTMPPYLVLHCPFTILHQFNAVLPPYHHYTNN
jgi:hypothetical protein